VLNKNIRGPTRTTRRQVVAPESTKKTVQERLKSERPVWGSINGAGLKGRTTDGNGNQRNVSPRCLLGGEGKKRDFLGAQTKSAIYCG